MDGRVIDIPFLSRWLLVNGVIAPFRAPKSAAVYRKVWMAEGSPLKVYGQQLEASVQHCLGPDFEVILAMRYQNPSIQEGLAGLQQKAVNQIIVVPLFPQYASATSGSVYELVMKHIATWQAIPSITFAGTFFNADFFITPIARQIRQRLKEKTYDQILFTYHGLPERQIRKADTANHCLQSGCCDSLNSRNFLCYRAQCFETSRILAKEAGLTEGQYTTTFQSRLGKDPWIKPYTDEVIKEWPGKGIKTVLALSPSFVADCLETTEEIGMEYRELFLHSGGQEWDLLPCLNNDPEWAEGLSGWLKAMAISPGQKTHAGHPG